MLDPTLTAAGRVSRRTLLHVAAAGVAVVTTGLLSACGAAAATTATGSAASSAAAPTSAAASNAATSSAAPAAVSSTAASSAPIATGAKATKVTFWHGNSGVLGDELKKLTDQFNSSQSGVSVDAQFIGDYTALNQKLLASLAAGNPPELTQAGANSYIAAYLKAGAVAPVDEFLRQPPPIGLTPDDLKDIYQVFLDDNTFPTGGKKEVVSWPFNKSDEVLYYNPDLLKAAGISAPPATWDDFTQQADTITKGGKAKGIGWTPATSDFTAMLYAYGGTPVNDAGDTVQFNGGAGVKALSLLAGMAKSGSLYLTKSYDWQSDFEHLKSAFALSTIVSRAYIEADLAKAPSSAFTLGIAALPKGDKPSTVLFGSNAVIFSKASKEQQQGAWTYLKWYTAAPQTAAWSLTSGYMPIRRSALDAEPLKGAIAKDPRRKVAIDELEYAHPYQPNIAAWAQVDTALTDAITSALLQKQTAEQALTDAAKKSDDILKNA